jgi:hypothetical protein
MAHHMMIDEETWGTRIGSVIVQLGAVVFDPEGGDIVDKVQWTIHGNSCQRLGGRIDAETVLWWMRQSDKARESISNPTYHMPVVLNEFRGLYAHHGCSGIWSHGATFDIPMLEFYYNRMELDTPWKYNEARDTRTLFDYAKRFRGWKPEADPPGFIAHVASWDAHQQAVNVQSALRALRQGPIVDAGPPGA